MSSTSAELVEVTAPSRIHITLIDMNGSTGRRDGSVGFAVDAPRLVLRGRRTDQPHRTAGPLDDDRRQTFDEEVKRAAAAYGASDAVALRVVSDIPAHVGLGSGTQLRLAVGTVVAHLAAHPAAGIDPVALSGRGGTSGIGVHAFARGGFLVDGGHPSRVKSEFAPSRFATGGRPPPLLLAADPPPEWRILLVLPDGPTGLAGVTEYDFMRANTPVPLAEVREVSHLVLLGLMPAVLEADLDRFGQAVTELQDVGWKLRHWRRPELRRWRALVDIITAAGAAGAGLSSTGPLLYGIFDSTRWPDEEIIERVRADATRAGLPLSWIRSAGFGTGARIATRAGSEKDDDD